MQNLTRPMKTFFRYLAIIAAATMAAVFYVYASDDVYTVPLFHNINYENNT